MVPVLAAALLCLSFLVVRAAQAARSEQLFGQMSQVEAAQFARDTVSRITGASGRAKVKAISPLSAVSVRRETRLREWHVVCAAPTGEYLVRINADTQRVFSVNRIVRRRPVPMTPGQDAWVRLSREEAQERARKYLRQTGATNRAINALQATSVPYASAVSPDHIWLFTANRQVPGIGQRTVKVAVNAGSGALESLWNPHATL